MYIKQDVSVTHSILYVTKEILYTQKPLDVQTSRTRMRYLVRCTTALCSVIDRGKFISIFNQSVSFETPYSLGERR